MNALERVERCADCLYPIEKGKIAIVGKRRRICYSCATVREQLMLRTARRYTAYLSTDGSRLITWTGNPLARVLTTKTARVGFADGSGRRPERWYLTAIDDWDHFWLATSPGPDMYARMRRAAPR